jgi:MFS family permease
MTRIRGFVLVALLYAVVLSGVTLPSPLYGLYQSEYLLTTATITALFATYPAGVLVVLLFTGTWSDALGRRPCLLIAALTSVGSSVAFLAADGPVLLFVGRALTGIASGFMVASANASLIELAPEHRKVFASVTSSVINQVGLGLGALVAGLAVDHAAAPLRLSFAVHACVVAVAISALWFIPETALRTTRLSVMPRSLGLPSTGRSEMLAACAAGFAAFALCGLLAALAPFFVTATIGPGRHTAAGVAVFAIFALSAVSQPLWARLDPVTMMRWALVILVVSMLAFAASVAATSAWGFFASVCVGGIGVGGVFMGSLREVNALAEAHELGRVTSTYFVAAFAGLVLPVVGTGWVTDRFGLTTAAVTFTSVITLLSLGCLVPFLAPRAGRTPLA